MDNTYTVFRDIRASLVARVYKENRASCSIRTNEIPNQRATMLSTVQLDGGTFLQNDICESICPAHAHNTTPTSEKNVYNIAYFIGLEISEQIWEMQQVYSLFGRILLRITDTLDFDQNDLLEFKRHHLALV